MKDPALILGSRRSGLAAARLLSAEGRGGWTVSEQAPEAPVRGELSALGFPWREKPPAEPPGLAVISPGFPADHGWLLDLRHHGVSLVPEFELGAERLCGLQIAITGSLGKTSMAMLAGELIRASGRSVTISGNIGAPVCETARTTPAADAHVLELSSFQLEQSLAYRPDLGICLNLLPNHLDRHKSMERYAWAKAQLFTYQADGDLGWWPEELEVLGRAPGTTGSLPKTGSGVRKPEVQDFRLPELRGTPFERGPLRENLRILLAGLEAIGLLPEEGLEERLRAFRFPPHRMQRLRIPGAGRVIDDSKSTCLAASRAALMSVDGSVQMILGGLGKGEPLDLMNESMENSDVSLYLIGSCADEMQAAWGERVGECGVYPGLEAAVNAAWTRRDCVATLLFSPGCASFDQYNHYMERGQHFQRLVADLAARNPLPETP